MNNTHDKIREAVLEKIRSNEVRMKSRWIFMFNIALLVVLTAIVFVASAFLLSIILFGVIMSGRLLLFGFGLRGIEIFLLTFPWPLLTLDVILMICIALLLKKFKFGYRSPLLYSAGGVVFAIVCIGVILDYSPVHPSLSRQEQRHHLMPPFGYFYSNINRPPHEQGVFRGVVILHSSTTILLQNSDPDSDYDAEGMGISSSTSMHASSSEPLIHVFLLPSLQGAPNIAVGDTVYVAGDIGKKGIYAYGIEKVENKMEKAK